MPSARLSLLVSLSVLAACSGGGGGSSSAAPPAAAASAPSNAIVAAGRPTVSAASAAAGTAAIPGAQGIYVANLGNKTVTEYAASAPGVPIRTYQLAGAPVKIAVSSVGTLAVLESAAVEVFARGSTAVTRTIAGPATGLLHPDAIAIEPSGRIYVADAPPTGANDVIRTFDPTANGNVAPVAVGAYDVHSFQDNTNDLAFNAETSTLYALYFADFGTGNRNEVFGPLSIPPGGSPTAASSNLTTVFMSRFSGAVQSTIDMTVEGSTTVVTLPPFEFNIRLACPTLALTPPSVHVFDASGDTIRTIVGPDTTIACTDHTTAPNPGNTTLTAVFGAVIALDGTIFVVDQKGGCASGDIAVFAPGANGDATPVALIGAGSTGIDQPIAIQIGPV